METKVVSMELHVDLCVLLCFRFRPLSREGQQSSLCNPIAILYLSSALN